jgi:hypothetical protein
LLAQNPQLLSQLQEALTQGKNGTNGNLGGRGIGNFGGQGIGNFGGQGIGNPGGQGIGNLGGQGLRNLGSCQSLFDDPQSYMEGIHPLDKERMLLENAAMYQTGYIDAECRVVRPDTGSGMTAGAENVPRTESLSGSST